MSTVLAFAPIAMKDEAAMREAAMAALKQQLFPTPEPDNQPNGGDYVPPHKRAAEGGPGGSKSPKVNHLYMVLAIALHPSKPSL